MVRAGWGGAQGGHVLVKGKTKTGSPSKDRNYLPTVRSEKGNPGTPGSIAIGGIGTVSIQLDCGTLLLLSLTFHLVCTENPYMNSRESQMVLKP